MLLTISVLAFAAFGATSASASVVCMVDSNTAGLFDANSTSQNVCDAPPGVSGTDETNNVSITRNVADNPLVPGTQQVTSITFTDSNPITIGDLNNTPPAPCKLDNANQATCPASDFTFDTGGLNDTVATNGNPTQLPSPFGIPSGCGGGGSFFLDATLGAGDDTFNGGVGDDAADGGLGADNMNGGDGGDSLEGGDGNDVIHGGSGQDCTDGGAGDDQEFGESGNDAIGDVTGVFTFTGDRGNDTLDGGDGNDNISPGAGPLNTTTNGTTITTTTDNDTITGGGGVDSVSYGARGNRTTTCTVAEDGQANDGETAHKQSGPLFANGQAQPSDVPAETDNLAGDIENLTACDGPTTLIGNNDDNVLNGGLSNDNIAGQGGSDSIFADAGDDVVDAGDGNDFVNGDFGNDAVSGGAGDDVLTGSVGNDQVNGGDGDDQVSGGGGPTRPDATVPDSDTDVISGGNGEDLVSYGDRSSIDPVTVSLDGQANDGEINVPNRINENDNVGTDVEDLDGGDGPDTLTGSPGDNSIVGLGGNDTIVGSGGNDGLFGSGGNDTINAAGAGSTHLDGGDGNDTLVSVDQSRDENQCGAGTDAVSADGRDEVHGDCENVKVTPPAAATIGKASVTKTGYVLVRVTCPATEPRCTGVVTIKTKKRVGKIIIKLGNASYSANGGKTAVVKAIIPPSFREALRKKKRVALAIAVTNVNATTGLSSTTKATRTVKTSILPKKK